MDSIQTLHSHTEQYQRSLLLCVGREAPTECQTSDPGEAVCLFYMARGTVDQIFAPAELLTGSWEFDSPVYMCFVCVLEKVYDHFPQGFL